MFWEQRKTLFWILIVAITIGIALSFYIFFRGEESSDNPEGNTPGVTDSTEIPANPRADTSDK